MPHEIHTSERRSFRGCRRRWNWAYRDGFMPEDKPKPLEFGIAFHKAMEVLYDPQLWQETTFEDRLTRAIIVFENECLRQREEFLRITNQQNLDEAQGDDYQERIELGIGMLKHYVRDVQARFDGWFKPVATEISFEVPIGDPDSEDETLVCRNSPACGQEHDNYGPDSHVVYAGRIDLLVEDIRYGGYYILDWKTASSLSASEEFLQLDDQIASYCWALSLQLGLDVRGFIYSEIRKDFPREPKVLKRVTKGCSFSTAKTQSTNIATFVPHVKEHDPIAYDEGKYDEYIAYLKSIEEGQYHQRFVIVKSTTELKNIGRNISLETADMVDPKLRIYPSVGKFMCSNCAFRQPCLGMFMEEDVNYQFETNFVQTMHRYWMDREPTSDKESK